MKFATIQELPPFVVAGLRAVGQAAGMFIYMTLLTVQMQPEPKDWQAAAIVGALAALGPLVLRGVAEAAYDQRKAHRVTDATARKIES